MSPLLIVFDDPEMRHQVLMAITIHRPDRALDQRERGNLIMYGTFVTTSVE